MLIPFLVIAIATAPGWLCIPLGAASLWLPRRQVGASDDAEGHHSGGDEGVLNYDPSPRPSKAARLLVWALAAYPFVLVGIMLVASFLMQGRTGLWPHHLSRDTQLTPIEDVLAVLSLVGISGCAAVQFLMLGLAIRELRAVQPDRSIGWAAIAFGLGTILSAWFGVASQYLAWLIGD